MIVTVTLNPAVDKTYFTGAVLTGQINRMRQVMNIPGGKGINVSKILRRFDKEVAATGFLGGYNGRFIEDHMREIGVMCGFTHLTEETRTSINVIGNDGIITELLEPGPRISEEQLGEFLTVFSNLVADAELVVMSGSVARGLPSDIYGSLITVCKERGVRVILDSSGEALMGGIQALPTMIKPNLKELEYVAGERLKTVEDIAQAARIINRMGVSAVAVTMGGRGMVYVDDDESYYVSAPHVQTISTVGCGDCVTAACAIAMTDNMETQEMLRFATAVGSANAMTMENGIIDKNILPKLQDESAVKKLAI